MTSPDVRRRAHLNRLPLALATCGVALVLLLQPASTAEKAPRERASGDWGLEWSEPVNLGETVNTSFNENTAALSKDGLTLYFASSRPGGLGAGDIWVTHREAEDAPWETPVNVVALNSAASESSPALSRDEHWMFIETTRPGGAGASDIWASWRQHTRDDLGWEAPFNLGPAVNWVYEDQGPGYFEGEDGAPPELYYATNRRLGAGFLDINVSRLQEDGTFGPPELVPELSSPSNEFRPQLTHDGLEIFFASNRPGGLGLQDIWTSTRPDLFSPWDPPVNLGAVNTSANDNQPTISADRKMLLFMSTRPGGYGGQDLWMSVRTRVRLGR